MQVTVNGKKTELDEDTTITDVIVMFQLLGKAVIVELEGHLIERQLWDVTTIKDGMNMELMHVVGGG
jgi:thiamine biosynthesis protein ThiS